MRKTLIITIAIVILLLALLTWVYLFFFGTPQSSEELFADLGFNLAPQPTVPVAPAETPTEQPRVDIAGVPLRQLTIRPVAGFVSLTTDDGPVVRYAERGTAHVYEIDLTTGEEKRLSNTTIPRIVSATFDPSGTNVVLVAANGYEVTGVVGRLEGQGEGGSLRTATLQPNPENVQFLSTSTLHYTVRQNGTTIGYDYNIVTNSQVERFRVPFWSVKSFIVDGQAYVTNRYAPELLGGVYEARGTRLESVMPQKFGLNAMISGSYAVYGLVENGTARSEARSLTRGEVRQIPLTVIPEKCTTHSNNPSQLVCGAPLANAPTTYTQAWYQGTVRSNDALWEIAIDNESATLIVDPLTTVGRELDITWPQLHSDGTGLFFINKNDGTLWQYDFTVDA